MTNVFFAMGGHDNRVPLYCGASVVAQYRTYPSQSKTTGKEYDLSGLSN